MKWKSVLKNTGIFLAGCAVPVIAYCFHLERAENNLLAQARASLPHVITQKEEALEALQ